MHIEQSQKDAEDGSAVDLLTGPHVQLILQRAHLELADVVTLLLTSKPIHSVVLETCRGLLSVSYRTSKAVAGVQPFIRWLARYGTLVGRLMVRADLPSSVSAKAAPAVDDLERSAGEQAIAASLQQAAHDNSTPGADSMESGLCIKACTFYRAGKGIEAVLRQLPGNKLTELYLHITQPHWSAEQPKDYVSHFSSSLSHLTSLRRLQLDLEAGSARGGDLGPMLPQLSRLTKLTYLHLSKVTSDVPLHLLPSSIKDLNIDACYNCAPLPQLHLGHLTTLTYLGCLSSLKLPKDCTLPPSLLSMCAHNLIDATCFTRLQNLKELELEQDNTENPSADLKALSALSALTHVKISYRQLRGADVSGWFWNGIPLKYLKIFKSVEADAVCHLAQLTQLTHLDLMWCQIACSPAVFAAVLKNLTNLQHLALEGPLSGASMFLHEGSADSSSSSSSSSSNSSSSSSSNSSSSSSANYVFGALTRLHQLIDLRLVGLPVNDEAALQLARNVAGQLTGLALDECSMNNSSLTALLPQCSQLRVLDVSNNRELSDEVLPIVASLPLLRILWCSPTGITKTGFQQYLPDVTGL